MCPTLIVMVRQIDVISEESQPIFVQFPAVLNEDLL